MRPGAGRRRHRTRVLPADAAGLRRPPRSSAPAASPPVLLKYLGQGVQKVRFSGGTAETPAQILLEFLDGNFALYDSDGNPRGAAAQLRQTALRRAEFKEPPAEEGGDGRRNQPGTNRNPFVQRLLRATA